MDQRISVLEQKRRAASSEHIVAAIREMQIKGLPEGSGIAPSETVNAYNIALEGVSHTAVMEAAKRFIAGKVQRHSHSFMPNAPEFAIAAREIDRVISSDIARLLDEKASLDELIENARKPKATPESMDRVRATHAWFKQQHEASKSRGRGVIVDTFDDEHAARMKKILALPERPGVTEDERIAAKKMADKLSSIEQASSPV